MSWVSGCGLTVPHDAPAVPCLDHSIPAAGHLLEMQGLRLHLASLAFGQKPPEVPVSVIGTDCTDSFPFCLSVKTRVLVPLYGRVHSLLSIYVFKTFRW